MLVIFQVSKSSMRSSICFLFFFEGGGYSWLVTIEVSKSSVKSSNSGEGVFCVGNIPSF